MTGILNFQLASLLLFKIFKLLLSMDRKALLLSLDKHFIAANIILP